MHVYAPRQRENNAEELLPVVFWIYGGAFVFGDGRTDGFYDGVKMASRHNVVVVAVNYRVDALGFMAHDHLQDENKDGSTGNMGIQDQRLGMRWVQNNINAFGGDPDRVTLWGQSAGAMSVCHHVANGAHPGLFKAGIMDSGNCDSSGMFQPLAGAKAFGDSFADTLLGCSDNSTSAEFLSCIRALSLDDIMAAVTSIGGGFTTVVPMFDGLLAPDEKYHDDYLTRMTYLPEFFPTMPWTPVVDGTEVGLPDVPLNMVKSGRQNKNIPVTLGTNDDEGTIFLPFMASVVKGVSFPPKAGDMELVLHHLYGDDVDVTPILSAYPSSSYKSETGRGAAIVRDYLFRCPARRSARAFSETGVDTYLYQYSYRNEWVDSVLLGAYHTAELDYVWGNDWPHIIHEFYTENDKAMRDTL